MTEAITCDSIFPTIKSIDSFKIEKKSHNEEASSKDNREEEKNLSYVSISRKESMSAFS